MTSSRAGYFRCQTCGRWFGWKPELAGRAARCPCGQNLTYPDHEPADEADLYDLAPADAPSAPVRRARKNPAPALQAAAMQSAPAARTSAAPRPVAAESAGPTLPYARPASSASGPESVIHMAGPLWILVGGTIVEFVADYLQSDSTGLIAQVQTLGAALVVATALSLVSVAMAARLRGIRLGSPGTVLLKLAALSVGPGAALDLLNPFLRILPFGPLIGLGLYIVLLFTLLGLFFELDESDSWFFLGVLVVVHLGVIVASKFWLHA